MLAKLQYDSANNYVWPTDQNVLDQFRQFKFKIKVGSFSGVNQKNDFYYLGSNGWSIDDNALT